MGEGEDEEKKGDGSCKRVAESREWKGICGGKRGNGGEGGRMEMGEGFAECSGGVRGAAFVIMWLAVRQNEPAAAAAAAVSLMLSGVMVFFGVQGGFISFPPYL